MRHSWLGCLVLGLVAACGSVQDSTPASEPVAEERACGDTTCEQESFCVATQGAVCMPLPPEGESCAEGCVLTEHCCNCSAYACVPAPADHCPEGPTCACLADSGEEILRYCEPDRRECTDEAEGASVLCIAVGLDEDPFADE